MEFTCGIARNDSMRRHVPGHNGPGADNGTFTDCDTAQNCRIGTDRGTFANKCLCDLPVFLGLKTATVRSRTGILVVCETDTMAYKTLILDVHAFADERMARDLAPGATEDRSAAGRVFPGGSRVSGT